MADAPAAALVNLVAQLEGDYNAAFFALPANASLDDEMKVAKIYYKWRQALFLQAERACGAQGTEAQKNAEEHRARMERERDSAVKALAALEAKNPQRQQQEPVEAVVAQLAQLNIQQQQQQQQPDALAAQMAQLRLQPARPSVRKLVYDPSALSSAALLASGGIHTEIPVLTIDHNQVLDTELSPAILLEDPWFCLGALGEFHAGLSPPIIAFLRNRRFGSGEDGLHSRDDAIFDVICLVGKLLVERNRVAPSTVGTTRSDAYLYAPGKPALVHVEEKAHELDLPVAQSELENKFFASLPHYNEKLQFIVGIAIAGDLISFHALSLRGQFPTKELARFSLDTVSARLQCVRAAVNVGRWAKWAMTENEHGPFVHSGPIYGRTIKRERSMLTFKPAGVVAKTYNDLDPERLGWLLDLYTQIAVENGGVPHMEAALSVTQVGASFAVELRPIGVNIMPRTAAQLRAALRCVLRCLKALHAKGWAHLDLRWSNVVWCGGDEWVVIDCEYARPFGSPMPTALSACDAAADATDAAADLYLVGGMMQQLGRLWTGDEAAAALAKLLRGTPRDSRTAHEALKLAYFTT